MPVTWPPRSRDSGPAPGRAVTSRAAPRKARPCFPPWTSFAGTGPPRTLRRRQPKLSEFTPSQRVLCVAGLFLGFAGLFPALQKFALCLHVGTFARARPRGRRHGEGHHDSTAVHRVARAELSSATRVGFLVMTRECRCLARPPPPTNGWVYSIICRFCFLFAALY